MTVDDEYLDRRHPRNPPLTPRAPAIWSGDDRNGAEGAAMFSLHNLATSYVAVSCSLLALLRTALLHERVHSFLEASSASAIVCNHRTAR